MQRQKFACETLSVTKREHGALDQSAEGEYLYLRGREEHEPEENFVLISHNKQSSESIISVIKLKK